MSKSPITHAAALEALAHLHHAATGFVAKGGFDSMAVLFDALSKAALVLDATAKATPADQYTAAKQAKQAAKAKLKDGQI